MENKKCSKNFYVTESGLEQGEVSIKNIVSILNN